MADGLVNIFPGANASRRASDRPTQGTVRHPPVRLPLHVVALAVGASAAIGGVVVSWDNHPFPLGMWLALQTVGIGFTAVGAFELRRHPDRRVGTLCAAVGVTWYIGDLQTVDHPLLFAGGFVFYHLVAVLFAHLVLALPHGRLGGPADRAVISLAYVSAIGTQIGRYAFDGDRQPQGWGDPHVPYSTWSAVGSASAFLFSVAIAALAIRRIIVAGRPMRTAVGPMWAALAIVGAIVATTAAAEIVDVFADVQQLPLLILSVALLSALLVACISTMRAWLARARVADLAAALRTTVEPWQLRQIIARTVGDPTLDLMFARRDGSGYVTAEGEPTSPALEGPRRSSNATANPWHCSSTTSCRSISAS